MNNLSHIQNYYFIGIGGIGMSALARFFKSQGKYVAGYDKTASVLTKELEAEGILVTFKDDISEIPKQFKDSEKTLVVYTPAVPKENLQLQYFIEEQFILKKRAEVLGLISSNRFTLAVAGTHGKTTTTAILGHLLKETNAPVTAFLGGVSEDIQSNLILKGDEVIVAEADEFDRSFLHLSPNIAAINSMDADHLDIYGVNEHLQASFKAFAALLPKDGILFVKNGLPLEGKTIGIEDDADFSAINIKILGGNYHFDLKTPTEIIEGFTLHLPGRHNVLNAVTALAMALEYGSPAEQLRDALQSFKGIRRRFSYKIKTDQKVLIDDYAHHPAEIKAVFEAVREMYPKMKNLVVFQPHLFSRTRDFVDDFAEKLSQFDEVMLMDIYPAREKPIEGVDSQWLLEKINNPNKQLVKREELSAKIITSKAKVVLMLGAGDIGNEVETVKRALEDEI
ncbi:MAG: UDP-N-acetylmuramate--L-alanine ligase [Zunongwangia sp.]|uniref:UDP-N-acetylmuramate--L-alanine ligase n=3 Tax=Zunongwangia profunda TaxID=398743 RepID=D5BLI7_ZUNPS|nr:UDP-N-acetylmuramate--L-alanine ligase [Zunongwangia profunda]ADF54113.1 UDP-N-acetylmuramate--L-alanine ligase [Zunongwangia profunda SM-A87]MAO37105.1 UDP-N-acetylmuramate--L-alanine ligase [Zunongwangia sp.]MAS72325.1 UDP-N-acetylmuramate--L-alanine ligase [Zunongwangia sp.]HAJ82333.1 UDP-N-acetylmuramate--L-alanine ligase [Zunongwangia profunda]